MSDKKEGKKPMKGKDSGAGSSSDPAPKETQEEKDLATKQSLNLLTAFGMNEELKQSVIWWEAQAQLSRSLMPPPSQTQVLLEQAREAVNRSRATRQRATEFYYPSSSFSLEDFEEAD